MGGAPVRTGVTVHAVRGGPQGFQIQAGDDLVCARAVVLATGACILPAIPAIAAAVPPSVTMLTPLASRHPGQPTRMDSAPNSSFSSPGGSRAAMPFGPMHSASLF